jgi:hypothetical protein
MNLAAIFALLLSSGVCAQSDFHGSDGSTLSIRKARALPWTRWGHRAPDPLTQGLFEEGANSVVATPPSAPSSNKPKTKGSRALWPWRGPGAEPLAFLALPHPFPR